MKKFAIISGRECVDGQLEVVVGVADPMYHIKTTKIKRGSFRFSHSEENPYYNVRENRVKYYIIDDVATLLEMAEKGVLFELL